MTARPPTIASSACNCGEAVQILDTTGAKQMRGVVRWYHNELKLALLEREDGFTMGSIEEGSCSLSDVLAGQFRRGHVETLFNESKASEVRFLVEAAAMTEDQVNEILGFIRP